MPDSVVGDAQRAPALPRPSQSPKLPGAQAKEDREFTVGEVLGACVWTSRCNLVGRDLQQPIDQQATVRQAAYIDFQRPMVALCGATPTRIGSREQED